MKSHSWEFYLLVKKAWKAMYLDCRTANKSIEIEEYILENDKLGQRFLKLFIKKAKEGIKVTVICDPFGSSRLIDSPLIKELRKAGGEFHFYQSLKFLYLFDPRRWFPRTHVKTLLIDSKIVYTGGVCLSRRMANWRDTHIRITGPVARDVRRAFDLRKKKISVKQYYKEEQQAKEHDFYYIQNRPIKSSYTIYRELVRKIKEAQNYIYISTAFFIPSEYFIYLLQKAAKRGVDVRILTAKRSDFYLADLAALSYMGKLVRKKVRAFLYEKNVFHCKTMIVDDKWATVGSANMDVLSFFYNREANIITTNNHAIFELKEQFFLDLNYASELNNQSFAKINLIERLIGFMARSIKVFLVR